MKTIEEALSEERKNITFSIQKMSEFLHGKKEYAQIKNAFNTFTPIPYDFNLFNRGRVQLLKQTIRDFPLIYNSMKKQRNDGDFFCYSLCYMNQLPGSAHYFMFIKCIQIMGTKEQGEKYLAKANNYDIVGCYAQTQIAHGSDVRGLLTTATFNQEKDSFIINTPSIEAAKYWPGDLGVFATHALIYAELIIKGKKHGINPFIVPIRDQNRNPLPGVEVGDIGPKIGFHTKDNGYLFLNNVFIPRQNMLQRFVEVSKEGKLSIRGNPTIGYATMMDIRKQIAYYAPMTYSLAITIATRYSFFRRQFKSAANEEIRVIDYQLQQQKIIERVSQYFALSIAGRNIKNLCDKNIEQALKNDFSLMSETHVCLCLGKTFSSETAYNGMQICRKACGGHGFSHYSGFPSLINQYAAHMTHQGQNTVLYLQVARYLMKNYKNFTMKQEPLAESIKYLESYDYLINKKCEVEDHSQWSLDDIRILLAQSVCYHLSIITEKMMAKPSDISDKQLWDRQIGIKLQSLAFAHAIYYNYNSFRDVIVMEKDERIKIIAQDLCKLFGAKMILMYSSPIISGGFINKQQISSLKNLKQNLLSKLRPNLIGIVDSFGVPDKFIRSALISGNPYENYLKLARQNELNHERLQSVDIVLSIKDHIKNPNPKL